MEKHTRRSQSTIYTTLCRMSSTVKSVKLNPLLTLLTVGLANPLGLLGLLNLFSLASLLDSNDVGGKMECLNEAGNAKDAWQAIGVQRSHCPCAGPTPVP
ncbi:hypothetical protein F4861DRAFT_543583 [Xylaria intraflava]|nr:hypothetical protein F4861DRAFT_543583 [Xylaria intraflava]